MLLGTRDLQILASLGLQTSLVTHIFVVGSHLWGTNTSSSDIDLVLVADDFPPESPKSQHKNQYDITIVTKAEFASRVVDGSLIETICCLLSEDETYCVHEAHSLRHLVLSFLVLERWVASRRVVDLEKSKKFWLKGKRKEAFKILQHMITAKSILRGLRSLLPSSHCVRDLQDISLTVAQLQAFVQDGRDENDWSWLGLEWSEVATLHTIRLNGIR